MLFYVIISQKRGNMFLFYIDESGEIAYNLGSKYFVFNALGINAKDWKSINHKVNELKTSIFKTDSAPILEVGRVGKVLAIPTFLNWVKSVVNHSQLLGS